MSIGLIHIDNISKNTQISNPESRIISKSKIKNLGFNQTLKILPN